MKRCLFAGGRLGGRFPKEIRAHLRGHQIELLENTYQRKLTEEDLLTLLNECDAVISGSEPYTKRVIDSAVKLKVIARIGVGYNNIDLKAATERGIYVTWTPIPELAYAVAEHTFALILSFLKKIPDTNRDVREGIWEPDKWGEVMDDLYHLTLGLLGLGRIGSEVAKRAKAFGMKTIYHDIARRKDLEENLGIRYVSFDELLTACDILSIHTPLTAETHELINEDALGLMKRNAIIVNTARGAIINEKSLSKALIERKLAGACLDVLSEEPPTEGHTFYKLGDKIPNVILTSHTGFGPHTGRAVLTTAADDVIRVLSGQRPKYLLNEVKMQSPRLKL